MSQDYFRQLAAYRRAKTKSSPSRDYFRERAASAAKDLDNLKKAYAASISIMVEVMAGVADREKQSECAFAIIRFGELATRMNVTDWSTMSVTGLLHARFPKHAHVERVFNELRIWTILEFCNADLLLVKSGFVERGMELPVHFEVLHLAYRRKAQK